MMIEDTYVEVALQAPPSPYYMPGPEEPEQAPLSPDYIPESDFEMHPEDDDDEDPDEDPVDYPADGGDDGDDEEESSEDEEDDEMDVEADEEEEEEEEHPAPADSAVVAPTAADQVPSAEETEPFETDESAATPPPHPAYRTTARISIPAPVPMAAWTDSESPEYVPESDFEAHQEDDDDEDPKEDPVDYLADGGDDGDDEEGSSKDDEDDDMDIEDDEEEEEEEHPAPANSIVVASTAADQASFTEETEPFETDESAATPPPHPAYRMTARISIPAPVPIPAWTDSDIVRLLAMSSPPASPLSPWSSPLPRIPFPPLPSVLSPPSPVLSPAPPPSPIRSLGYRAAMIRLRAEAASTSHSPPLQLPYASHREDRPDVTLPPQKRLAGGLRADYDFVATMDREIMRDPEREVGYAITNSWDEIVETLHGAPVSANTELGGYMREFETRVRQDTDEIYMRLNDEQTERQQLAGRLNMLFRDRRAHAYTRHLMETEARMSREAWVRSTDASDLVRGEVTALQGQVIALQAQVNALQGQQGLAGGPTQLELPEEAGSDS
nr:hypothetical protein [Tanacetum cinerariifolium]